MSEVRLNSFAIQPIGSQCLEDIDTYIRADTATVKNRRVKSIGW